MNKNVFSKVVTEKPEPAVFYCGLLWETTDKAVYDEYVSLEREWNSVRSKKPTRKTISLGERWSALEPKLTKSKF